MPWTAWTQGSNASEWKSRIEKISGKQIVKTIVDAEPIGPEALLDILVVAPCTGNTLGKLANGITDTAVTMACKAHLRNGKPLLLAPATNDGLGANGKNIFTLLNCKMYILSHLGRMIQIESAPAVSQV